MRRQGRLLLRDRGQLGLQLLLLLTFPCPRRSIRSRRATRGAEFVHGG